MDVSLWTDGQGHFGQWLVSDTPAYPDMQFYSHVRFQDGGGWQTAPAFTNGFYPLGGTHPQDGRLAIIVHNLWDFQSSGSLDGSKVTWSLATQDLGVDGTPWNHLEVDADGTTYHFPLMSTGLSSGSWITADLWVQGTDFNATLKHGLKYGTDLDYSLPQGASLPGGNTACP